MNTPRPRQAPPDRQSLGAAVLGRHARGPADDPALRATATPRLLSAPVACPACGRERLGWVQASGRGRSTVTPWSRTTRPRPSGRHALRGSRDPPRGGRADAFQRGGLRSGTSCAATCRWRSRSKSSTTSSRCRNSGRCGAEGPRRHDTRASTATIFRRRRLHHRRHHGHGDPRGQLGRPHRDFYPLHMDREYAARRSSASAWRTGR
jgi:hypothetical protein